MKQIPIPPRVFLSALLRQVRNRPRISLRLRQLCELLCEYPKWDLWTSHPLCFLTTEEVFLIHLYLHHGSEATMVAVTSGSACYIKMMLNRAIGKLKAGHQDYERVVSSITGEAPMAGWDMQLLILDRPFVLFGFSTQLTNALMRSDYNNFREMDEDQGIAAFLSKMYGIGEGGFAEIRVAFERYDLHGLLRPLELSSEYAHLNIVSNLNSAAG